MHTSTFFLNCTGIPVQLRKSVPVTFFKPVHFKTSVSVNLLIYALIGDALSFNIYIFINAVRIFQIETAKIEVQYINSVSCQKKYLNSV
jgi:hypothetical protein